MKYPEPQHMLGLRVMGKKGLDAYYPNGVTLILPGDISASQLEQYIHIKV